MLGEHDFEAFPSEKKKYETHRPPDRRDPDRTDEEDRVEFCIYRK